MSRQGNKMQQEVLTKLYRGMRYDFDGSIKPFEHHVINTSFDILKHQKSLETSSYLLWGTYKDMKGRPTITDSKAELPQKKPILNHRTSSLGVERRIRNRMRQGSQNPEIQAMETRITKIKNRLDTNMQLIVRDFKDRDAKSMETTGVFQITPQVRRRRMNLMLRDGVRFTGPANQTQVTTLTEPSMGGLQGRSIDEICEFVHMMRRRAINKKAPLPRTLEDKLSKIRTANDITLYATEPVLDKTLVRFTKRRMRKLARGITAFDKVKEREEVPHKQIQEKTQARSFHRLYQQWNHEHSGEGFLSSPTNYGNSSI